METVTSTPLKEQSPHLDFPKWQQEQEPPVQDHPPTENVLTKYQWVHKTFQHWNGTPFEAPSWVRKSTSTNVEAPNCLQWCGA